MTQELLNKINELPQTQQEDIIAMVEEYYETYFNKRKLQAKFNKIIAEMSECGMALGYGDIVFEPLAARVFMSMKEGEEYFNE